jgi:hypothetical protein
MLLVLTIASCKNFFVDPQLTSIALTADQASIAIGATDQLQAVGTFDDNSKKDLTGSVKWTLTPATGVVSVSPGGLLTGVGNGSATITAKSGIITSSADTIVVGTLTSITITPANSIINKNAISTQQFAAMGHYSGGATQDITSSVTWTASTADVTFSSSAPGLGTIMSVPTTNPIVITATSSVATGSVQGNTNLTINP